MYYRFSNWLSVCIRNGQESFYMKDISLRFFVRMQALKDALVRDESGQDLIEYALVVALIALAATVSMNSVATKIGTAFTSIGTKLTTYTS
jgi:pilus assembly protein Flp/PilA